MVSEETWHRMVRRANEGREANWREMYDAKCDASVVSCRNEPGVACKVRNDWGQFDLNKPKQGDR